MVSEELVEILACPETKQPVSLAEPSEIERLNQLVSQGKLVNRAGEKVEKPLDGGLVREDGRILYPIIEDIPVMLIEEGIPLKEG